MTVGDPVGLAIRLSPEQRKRQRQEDSSATQRLLNGRYELGPILGRGGMSEVRRGKDTALGREVAIKLLRGDGDPGSVARFEREAHVLARLHHPNVVTVFDVGADGDDRFIVMELVDGPTLREVLDAERLDPHRAAGIADGIAAALAYAHEQDIVHRDVKPSNVLIASEDHVKLADLGIAKLLSAEALTKTTGIIGTAHYIAPEQARGDPVDGRADLYSLGCVLFEMLVGRPPFEGDPAALMYAHVHQPAPRARSIAAAVPERLDALVAGLLEKEPSARPQSAAEVKIVLQRAAVTDGGQAAIPTEPRTSPEPTRRAPEDRESGPSDETLTSSEPTRLLPEDREWGSRPPVEPLTSPEPTGRPRPKRSPARRWIGSAAAAALVVLVLVVLLPILFAGDTGPNGDTGARSPQSSSPTTSESEPPAEPPSSREAAEHVFDVVGQGFAAGEIPGEMVVEVQHKIDEAFKEIEEHQDLEKALEKIADLQTKVSDSLEKGEITSSDRAREIDDALDELAVALQAEA